MRLFISLEHRFAKYRGAIYDRTIYGPAFWEPYLQVFDQIVIVARAREVSETDSSYQPVNRDRISFCEVPDYSGSLRSVWKIPGIVQVARTVSKHADALLIRTPCNVGHLLWWYGRQHGVPTAVEVVGDLWDASICSGWLLKTVRRGIIVPLVQAQCREASVASYVTSEYLQKRFTPGDQTAEFVWSDNQLTGKNLRSEPRQYHGKSHCNLVYTANFARYKGHDMLLKAYKKARQNGFQGHLTLIGEGPIRPAIELKASKLGLSSHITFTGSLPNDRVLQILEDSDMYVTSSLTEGLPRAVVEAQARALPVVGFAVGGLPELVPPQYLVKSGDVPALAGIITRMAENHEEMNRASALMLSIAARYTKELQMPARIEAYRTLKRCAEERIGCTPDLLAA